MESRETSPPNSPVLNDIDIEKGEEQDKEVLDSPVNRDDGDDFEKRDRGPGDDVGADLKLSRTKSSVYMFESLSLPREIMFVGIICMAQLTTREHDFNVFRLFLVNITNLLQRLVSANYSLSCILSANPSTSPPLGIWPGSLLAIP